MAANRGQLLLVDEEPATPDDLRGRLENAGFVVVSAESAKQARSFVDEYNFDVVVSGLCLPDCDGLSFVQKLKDEWPEQNIAIITAYGNVSTAVEAVKSGASEYLEKACSQEELVSKLEKLSQDGQLENDAGQIELRRSGDTADRQLVGKSPVMENMFSRIKAVAPLDTTVLIEGESGSGKELVARTIHASSPRRDGPFVAFSCAALPADLMESELFGHEAGAFTGATKSRIGRFEAASGGTIFLDDVDDIPREVQVKLLRVLQERELERIGSLESIRVNVRVLTAAKRSLVDLVRAGQFREDLYYRFCVVPIQIPPLRERCEDIPLLAQHFLDNLAARMNCRRFSLTPAAAEHLQSYHWPGNVRELEHLMERMVAISNKTTFDFEDIPLPEETSQKVERLVSLSLEGIHSVDLEQVLTDVEEQLVHWALAQADGNLAQAAKLLNVPRSTLQYKLTKYGSRESAHRYQLSIPDLSEA